ncbi:MAG: histidine--tRNA ligase [Bacilli bacterium]|nr:histidine--tRNA ligase [Bacilli bacterium]
MLKIQNVRGCYDYLPEVQNLRNYVIDTLKQIFIEYGYQSIETPILCYYDMLSDKYDENNDILKEIYRLTDQGKRDLGLRYDLTVPFAKFIALNKKIIQFPFKRYEIAKVFRDGPIKVGRDREFIQCDVDVVGLSGQDIEAELLTLFINAFKKLKIDIIIKYNNRKLMTGLIKECNITSEVIASVTTIIDKLDKVTKEEFKNLLKEIGLNDKQIEQLNNYFNYDLEKLNEKFNNTTNELIKNGLQEINNLYQYIKYLKIDNICQFDITLARGQNYYTGNVFEVYQKDRQYKSSIGGGGRYDIIIGNFINDGNNYPTVGISFGLSAICEILKNSFNQKVSNIDIYIIPLDTKMESLSLAIQLRNLNYKVEIDMTNRKLKKILEYTDNEKIPYVIILGTDEINNNIFKLKDMLNKQEFLIDMNNLDEIKDIII